MTITITLVTLLFSLIVLYVLRNKEKWVLNEKIRTQLSGNFIKLSNGTVHYKIEKSTYFKNEKIEQKKSQPSF